jgi:formylglycine-generating enzyme required for sulfatase activity
MRSDWHRKLNRIALIRCTLWLAGAAAAVGCTGTAATKAEVVATAAPTVPGLVTEKPAEGRFVKCDDGYMVPYTQTIPGTEVSFEMVPVPGGEFLMGSPPSEAERADDEGPQVRVKVAPFWIGKHEVTWAEYHSFMSMYDVFKKMQLLTMNRGDGDAAENLRLVQMHAWNGEVEDDWGVDAVTAPTPLYQPDFTYSVGDAPDQPAVSMTQFAAKQYTKWISGITGNDYRLPSEAEWEYAARAGTTTAYSFGDDVSELEDYAWIEDNGDYQLHKVGTKKPNPFGLFDMHGNVAEWTLDEYQSDAYAKLGSSTVDAKTAVRWPTTPRPYPRAIRGGSWYEPAPAARSAARHKSAEDDEWKISDPNRPYSPWWYTEDPAQAIGMRIIRPLKPLTAEEKKRVWEVDVDDLREDVEFKLEERRGVLGIADKALPAAVQAVEELDKASER